jgi:hypothetical protein
MPTIQKLTRELWDLRRQVTAGVARETAILKELRRLNSSFVPEPSVHAKSIEDSGMLILNIKICIRPLDLMSDLGSYENQAGDGRERASGRKETTGGGRSCLD